MADTKAKGVNGNHAPTKSRPNSKLRDLVALAKEVSSESIQHYEKSLDDVRVLEQELEVKKGENQRLREFNDKVVREFSEHKTQSSAKTDTLFAEFESKYKMYESNKAAVETMKKEVAEMREKLAMAEDKSGDAEQLRQRLQSVETHAENHAAEIREMNSECELHRSRMEASVEELDVCKKKLVQAQGDLGEGVLREFRADDTKNLGADLKKLMQKVHGFVLEYFNDSDGVEDAESEIQELKARFSNIPLSTSTTKAAVKMRCAAAEAVIAEALLQHVFVPFYLRNDVKAAATAMLDFFGDDERRRTVYRCQILQTMTDAEEVKRLQEDVVRRASNEARSTLHPLVVAYKQAGFYNAVPAVFRQAVAVWADAQRSRECITAYEADASSQAGEYGQRSSKGQTSREPAATLFPQVSSRDGVVYEGVCLWASQTAVTEAIKELSVNGTNGDSKKHASTRRRYSATGSP